MPTPADPPSLSGFGSELHRAALNLRRRLEKLELRIRAGDEQAWPEYRETALAVVSLEKELREALPPGLTTKQMAELVGVTPRTLLRLRDLRPHTGAPAGEAGARGRGSRRTGRRVRV